MKKPWELHPEFTGDRLATVVQIICEARDAAVKSHHPEAGEGQWSLGCRAYERILRSLETKTASLPWLSIVERKNLYFVFAIGNAPLRFYVGDASQLQDKKRRIHQAVELRQLELAYQELSESKPDAVFRLIVEKDLVGRATEVFFVQVETNGAIANPWSIPIGDVGGIVIDFRKQGVQLPPPQIGDTPLPETTELEPAAESVDEED